MEFTQIEDGFFEHKSQGSTENEGMRELSEVQLALVGGGIGDVIVG